MESVDGGTTSSDGNCKNLNDFTIYLLISVFSHEYEKMVVMVMAIIKIKRKE
jgi:hypothetical protein